MPPAVKDRYEEALAAERPVMTLREAVLHRMKTGHVGRDQVLDELVLLSEELERQGRRDREEAVLDVMDMRLGWSPLATRID